MYDDSWYNFVPGSRNRSEDVPSQAQNHRRKDSLLKQPNTIDRSSEQADPMMELFEENAGLRGPPKATLAKRAKSHSDFHELAAQYLGAEVGTARSKDPFNQVEVSKDLVQASFYEDLEEDILDESHEEFQLYYDQLALSEKHLETLLNDTSGALDLLASLSQSFKTVELETTAFQAQCEDLLAEQKRLRDLADEVGTDLQYYAYLEPLTRRLNAPGAGRLARSDDFLDILLNLNTCIDFMDEHPTYRDSTVYKARYTTLLERALNIVQMAFTSSLREVSDDVAKELKTKDHTETAEYILLYGKFENVEANLGSQIQRLLKSSEFAFGQKGDYRPPRVYADRYHELFGQLTEAYLKSRESVVILVTKNLKKYITTDKPDTDFEHFARRCVQYILDLCHNEQSLVTQFFQDGPLLSDYGTLVGWNKSSDYAGRLEDNILSHLATLHTFLLPYLSNGDLSRICTLVNWLETMYIGSAEGEMDHYQAQDGRKSIAQALLSKHLWKTLDELFLKAANDIGNFKPSPDNLNVTTKITMISNKASKSVAKAEDVEGESQGLDARASVVSNAYPTVQTAVKLLVMYNEGVYDRPRISDVLYEIVHQATESLQKAATLIKRNTGIMDAQLFLIKNLMLIENLFMTHEIPDSVRQSAEFDFTPIWSTIQELQDRKQVFNPLAYITPLVKGNLLPAVVDRLLDARKELEKVLVQQITAFTKTWQARLAEKDVTKRELAVRELETTLNRVFEDETTRAALWKMIQAEE